MPTLHEITRKLHNYWDQQAPPDLQTLFPGTTLDTASLSEWVEVWIDSSHEEVRRISAPEQLMLFLTVHCFSQNRQDTLKVQQISDSVCSLLSSKVIPVTSPSGLQPAALIRTREATVRNLTRAHTVTDRNTLQHLVVTLTAVVTECGLP